MQILIVEDERKLAAAISEGLQASAHSTAVAHTAEEGTKLLRASYFDVLLLDVMLPRQSGLEMLREVRRSGFHTPVLILTSRDSIEDRVLGLDAGADDYLVKPFAFPELLARIRALSRRGMPTTPTCLQLADLVIDLNGRTAHRSGRHLDLTGREFDLLEYFLLHRGTVVSREMLARSIWKETARSTALENVIDVQIARLRRKVDDPFSLKLLHTIRGVGFILREGKE